MIVLGITGSSGSGKTLCSQIIGKEGFEIIDCDAIAHDVVKTPQCREEIEKFFGKNAYNENGYNRKIISSIVFNDKSKLRKLNEITHRYIIREIEQIISRCRREDKNVLIDAPLLYEARLEKICDKTVAVVADRDIKIQRLLQRDGITKDIAEKRLENQFDDEYYIKKSDYVIYNNDGDFENLYVKVINTLIKIKGELNEKAKKKAAKKNRILTPIIAVLLIAVIGLGGFYLYRLNYREAFLKSQYPLKYSDIIQKYSDMFGLEQSLVYGIIKTESNFDENAVSSADARGLMQLTPDTFDWALLRENRFKYGEEAIFDPEINIKYGCMVFRLFLDEFKEEKTAIAAYNAGRGAVNKWLKDEKYSSDGRTLYYIPYGETRYYVKKVTNNKEKYQQIYNLD